MNSRPPASGPPHRFVVGFMALLATLALFATARLACASECNARSTAACLCISAEAMARFEARGLDRQGDECGEEDADECACVSQEAAHAFAKDGRASTPAPPPPVPPGGAERPASGNLTPPPTGPTVTPDPGSPSGGAPAVANSSGDGPSPSPGAPPEAEPLLLLCINVDEAAAVTIERRQSLTFDRTHPCHLRAPAGKVGIPEPVIDVVGAAEQAAQEVGPMSTPIAITGTVLAGIVIGIAACKWGPSLVNE